MPRDPSRHVLSLWHLVGIVWLGMALAACQENEARVQRAERLFERARFQEAEQILTPLFEESAAQPDSVQHLYGKVLLARGEIERARDAYDRLLDRAPTYRDAALYGLARAHFYLGHPDTARTLGRRLLGRGRRRADPLRIAQGHHVIGRTHFYEAQYDRALAHQRKSLQWARRADSPATVEVRADALRQIGVLYWYRGQVDSARTAFYEPALRLYRRMGDSSGVATTLSNVGFLHWQKDEWKAHTRLQLRAFTMRRRMGDQIGLADSYSFLSEIPKYIGADNPTYRIKYARKALNLSREIGYAWGKQVASGRLTKALRRGLDDWDRPLPSLRAPSSQPSGEYRLLEVIRTAQTAHRSDRWRRTDTLLAQAYHIADSIGYHNFQRSTLVQRSQVLLRLGREDEARRLLRRVDTLDENGTRPWTKAGAARGRARLALRNGAPTRAANLLRPLAEEYDRRYLRTLHETAPEVAFQTAVETVHGNRSRIYGLLLDALVGRSPETTSSLRSGRKTAEAFATLERERRLPFWGGPQSGESEEFGRFVRQLETLEGTPGNTDEIQNLMTTLGEVYNRKLAEQRVLDHAGPTTADLDVTTRPALQRVLRRQEVFAEYFVSKDSMFVFVARRDTSAFLTETVSPTRLTNTVETYRQFVKRGYDHPRERLWQTAGHRIYESVIRPLVREGWLTPNDHLIVAPHRMLYGVPVHALPTPTAEDDPRFMIERYGVSYTPSATALVERRERPAPEFDSVLAAAPVAGRLPYTEREVQHIPSEPFAERRVLTKDEARADAVREGWTEYDLVHLAAHARTNEQFPLYSHLQLTDERIELHEVLRDSVQARLVVLSACETGRGVGSSGDVPTSASLVSFPRAVLSAGAGSVVASLWRVDDRATARLMHHFYRQLAGSSLGTSSSTRAVSAPARAPVGPAGALTWAQRRYLQEARTSDASAHPFYWAGFVLMGDGR